jgi:hypothetical protein
VDDDPRPGRFVLTGSSRTDLTITGWPATGRIVRKLDTEVAPRRLRRLGDLQLRGPGQLAPLVRAAQRYAPPRHGWPNRRRGCRKSGANHTSRSRIGLTSGVAFVPGLHEALGSAFCCRGVVPPGPVDGGWHSEGRQWDDAVNHCGRRSVDDHDAWAVRAHRSDGRLRAY